MNNLDRLRESKYDFSIVKQDGMYIFELSFEEKLLVSITGTDLDAMVNQVISYADKPVPDMVEPRPGLYTVGRTSSYGKPCEEAFKIRVDNGTHEEWAVQVDDLLAFIEKHGQCIVQKYENGYWDIEIYDDDRE